MLVAVNSVFQVLAFGLLGWFYLDLLPRWMNLGDGQGLNVSVWHIALNVIIFLGIPLLAGFLTRHIGERRAGRTAYEAKFLPRIGPWALYGLLFTIVVLFALQCRTITSRPLDVARIALPLLVYFAIMFFGRFLLGKELGLAYDRTATLAFTAAATISSWPSRSPSPPSASPPARPCPESSARSSKCRSSSGWSTWRSPGAGASPPPPLPRFRDPALGREGGAARRRALEEGASDTGGIASATSADGAQWADGSRTGADAAIWRTGLRPALAHLAPLNLRDGHGPVPTDGPRALGELRLHLLGHEDWTGPASATLIGVGRPARDAVGEIAQRRRGRPLLRRDRQGRGAPVYRGPVGPTPLPRRMREVSSDGTGREAASGHGADEARGGRQAAAGMASSFPMAASTDGSTR